MDRPLDSDQLGQLGETEFKALCVRAGLIPNVSTWDRKGWDFVVDWRETASTLSHDRRPTPRSCLVQVKTIWKETRSVRIRLASIDHLAKDLKPAFVVVAKINNELEVVEAGIAHLEGDFLSRVLKELRSASASGAAIGDIYLDLAFAKWFSPLPLDHRLIRQALEAAIGPSMEAYSVRKQRQLRDLGFEGPRFVMRGAILATDEDALIDGFLGLRPLALVDASAEELRFGIPIPWEDFGESGILNIQARPCDKCRIVIRQQGRDIPYIFKGKMFKPPREVMSPGRMKLLIRSDHFSITLDGRESGEPNIINFDFGLNVEAGLSQKRMSVAEWAQLYAFLAAVDGREPLHLDVQPDKITGPFGGSINLNNNDEVVSGWVRAGALAEAAAAVFGRAGWPAAKVTFNELASAESALLTLATLLTEPSAITPWKISTELVSGVEASDTIRLFCCHQLHVGEHMITHTVAAELLPSWTSERMDWTSRSLEVIDVSRLKPSQKGFENYAQTSLHRANASSFYIAAYNEPLATKLRANRAARRRGRPGFREEKS